MEIYELNYSDWEEFRFYLLTHKIRSFEDFKNDCDNVLITYFDEFLTNEKSWVGVDGMTDFVKKKLIEVLGYEEVETQRYGYSGSSIISGRDDTAIEKIIGKDLYNKALKHNKKIENRLYKRREF